MWAMPQRRGYAGVLNGRLVGFMLAAVAIVATFVLVFGHPKSHLTAHAGGPPPGSTSMSPTPMGSATPTPMDHQSEPPEPTEAGEPSEAAEPSEPPEPPPSNLADLKVTGELQLDATWSLELALAIGAGIVAAGRRTPLIRGAAIVVAFLLSIFLLAGLLRAATTSMLSWLWFVLPLLTAMVVGVTGCILLKVVPGRPPPPWVPTTIKTGRKAAVPINDRRKRKVQPSWQSTVIAIGFIAFAGFGLWLAVGHDFATIWAGIGTVIGVLTGAIPAYFFKQQADSQTRRANAFAGALAPETYKALIDSHPELAG